MTSIILSVQLILARYFAPCDIPSVEIVKAIIHHESRGRQYVCREDKNGASRGVMQIWRANTTCNGPDVFNDYDIRSNIVAGMWILAKQSEWHNRNRHTGHDVLEHYCGKGKSCKKFAKEVREIAYGRN